MPVDEPLNALATSVIGCAIEVHRHLGPGFAEVNYEEALAWELLHHRIPFERQRPMPLTYKGSDIGSYRLDLLVDQRLVVELKAVDVVARLHHAQLLCYLRLTRLRLGLLINFNVELLRRGITRIAN